MEEKHMADRIVGKVLGIALRCKDKTKMNPVSEARAVKEDGLEGDNPVIPNRGITFIAREQWETVMKELGVDLPWWTRRANVLVDAPSLAHLIGKTVRVGEIEVAIQAETKPCDLMDKQHMGLRNALKPDCRAGVYGRVMKGGSINIGDTVIARFG
jgi:MOSC domain-containing protein YiiM